MDFKPRIVVKADGRGEDDQELSRFHIVRAYLHDSAGDRGNYIDVSITSDGRLRLMGDGQIAVHPMSGNACDVTVSR